MSSSFLTTCAQRASDVRARQELSPWELLKLSGMLALFDFGAAKELGVVATRDLMAGETLIREAPLLRLWPAGPGEYRCVYSDPGGDRAQCQALIDTLSQHSYGRGLDDTAREAMTSTERAIETNAFVLDDSTALFLEISRFNHSCDASARFAWDDASGCGTIIMKHDLARGAEVTINYGTGKHSTLDRRQQHLFERFSFDCACDRCLAEEATEDAEAAEAQRVGIDRSWGRG